MLDDRNLRVTLQHPVPWFDELAAFPVAAPVPPRPSLYSGPVPARLPRTGGKLVLERNFNYWNAGEVKPSRLVLGTATKGADAVLPRQLAGPGLPWIDTAGRRRRRAPTSWSCSPPASSGSSRAGRRSPTSSRAGTSRG